MAIAPIIFKGVIKEELYLLITNVCNLYLQLIFLEDAVIFFSLFSSYE